MNAEDELLKRRIEIQEKILDALEESNFHGKIDVPFRVGKSHIGVKVLDSVTKKNIKYSKESLKNLWVTDSEKLRDVDVPNTFKVEGKEDLLDNTVIVCWASLGKLKGNFGQVILDEYQNVTTKNTQGFFNGNIKYKSIVAMTATEPKHWAKKVLLGRLALSKVAYVGLEEAIVSKIIADYRIHIVEFDLDDTQYIHKTKKGIEITEATKYSNLCYVIDEKIANFEDASFLFQARMRLLYGSIARQEVVECLASSKFLEDRRGLVFVPYKKLAKKLGHHYHSSSGDKDYNRFKDYEIDQLNLVKAGGVGHTYTGIEYIVIAQATKDYSGLTSQNWGRGLMYKEGEPVDIYILCCKGTVDERWVNDCISNLDPNKIDYLTYKNGVITKKV
jgi:superfamily II DNA or RNA helicase